MRNRFKPRSGSVPRTLLILLLVPLAQASPTDAADALPENGPLDAIEETVTATLNYVGGLNTSDSPDDILNKTKIFAQKSSDSLGTPVCVSSREYYQDVRDATLNMVDAINIDPEGSTLSIKTIAHDGMRFVIFTSRFKYDPNSIGCALNIQNNPGADDFVGIDADTPFSTPDLPWKKVVSWPDTSVQIKLA